MSLPLPFAVVHQNEAVPRTIPPTPDSSLQNNTSRMSVVRAAYRGAKCPTTDHTSGARVIMSLSAILYPSENKHSQYVKTYTNDDNCSIKNITYK